MPGVADNSGEGGLLGIALSPTFATDAYVYAYLTAATDNRIVRMTYRDGTLGAPSPVFTGIPKAGIHNGGRIAFGPDGLLYATAGDASQKDRAQDVTYLGGKVLRMTPDGQPAPGNPFPGSVVYTFGHRNPQGLAWGPDGSLYEAEFGQSTEDELNLLQAGPTTTAGPTVEGTVGSNDAEVHPAAADLADRGRVAVRAGVRRRLAVDGDAAGQTGLSHPGPRPGTGRAPSIRS